MARESRGLGRSAGTATERGTIAVVCEGEKTENIYLRGIRKRYRLATASFQFVGLGAEPLAVVEEAKKYVGEVDSVWAVFDVEASGSLAISHTRLVPALEAADRYGVKCAISHPCFEIWLILHFKLHNGYLRNDQAEALAKQFDCDYSDKSFNFEKIWPLRGIAISNAERLDVQKRHDHPNILDRNPWTTVHDLVKDLVSKIPNYEPPDSLESARGRERSGKGTGQPSGGRPRS